MKPQIEPEHQSSGELPGWWRDGGAERVAQPGSVRTRCAFPWRPPRGASFTAVPFPRDLPAVPFPRDLPEAPLSPSGSRVVAFSHSSELSGLKGRVMDIPEFVAHSGRSAGILGMLLIIGI